MTSTQLYELLDKASIKFRIVEIFEGVRLIRVLVEEEEEE